MAKGKYEEWLAEEKLILIEAWARDGLTEEQISKNMGIAYSTFRVWRDKFSAISAALKKGKEVVDILVENAMLKSALGHTETIRKPIKVKTEKSIPGKGKIIEERIEYAEEQVYIKPDITAQIFWLKNRKPDKWKDKPIATEIDVTMDDGLLAALSALDDELIDDSDFLPDEVEEDED